MLANHIVLLPLRIVNGPASSGRPEPENSSSNPAWTRKLIWSQIMPEKKTKVTLGLKNWAMLPSYFDSTFVHLRQKARLRPEIFVIFRTEPDPKSPVRLTTLLPQKREVRGLISRPVKLNTGLETFPLCCFEIPGSTPATATSFRQALLHVGWTFCKTNQSNLFRWINQQPLAESSERSCGHLSQQYLYEQH